MSLFNPRAKRAYPDNYPRFNAEEKKAFWNEVVPCGVCHSEHRRIDAQICRRRLVRLPQHLRTFDAYADCRAREQGKTSFLDYTFFLPVEARIILREVWKDQWTTTLKNYYNRYEERTGVLPIVEGFDPIETINRCEQLGEKGGFTTNGRRDCLRDPFICEGGRVHPSGTCNCADGALAAGGSGG